MVVLFYWTALNKESLMNYKHNTKQSNKTVYIVTLIVLLTPVLLIMWFFSSVSKHAAENPPAPDLNLSIKTGGGSISLINNEQGDLRNCNVEINKSYNARINRIGNEYGDYELSSFTSSNGERFNNFTHAVTSVVVDRCIGEDGRMGIYGK